jgi:sigma-B regulation protein RsbU (phosphoserine phosphatase)
MESLDTKQEPSMAAPIAIAEQTYLRSELERRQARLKSVLISPLAGASLSTLLDEVDAALARMDQGTYGLCQNCHAPIERERLLADPLVQFCLDDLTQEERHALEGDLAMAARIQQALLPQRNLSLFDWRVHYHYAPAGVVSGDYCDLFRSNDDLLFLLGDVSGKGVAASMLMSHLHATFRSLANLDLPLDRMVQAANRIFAESTLADQYATLVVGRASQDGSVEFVSAGHLPLLHLCGADPALAESTGLPLGMFTNAAFSVHRLHLAPGDGLLVYTDGMTEACNPSGEEYGVARMKTLAANCHKKSPDSLIADCLQDLQQFTSGTNPTDDLTLLAIQRAAEA